MAVSSASLGLAASEKTGDSPGVGSANIFLGRAGVYKWFRVELARGDSDLQKVVKHSDFGSFCLGVELSGRVLGVNLEDTG